MRPSSRLRSSTKFAEILSFSRTWDESRTCAACQAEGSSVDGRWERRVCESVRLEGDWRITFRIEGAEIEIIDLDYEDYR